MKVRARAVLPILCLSIAASVSADSESRPFTLILSGNANPVPTEDPCVPITTETGTGLASPIGIVKWESREVVNFCSNPQGADIEGEFVITAWNRDQIRGHRRMVAQADRAAGEITASGRYEITSGIGLLREAAGKGVIAAAGSLAPPFAFSGGLFGRIAF